MNKKNKTIIILFLLVALVGCSPVWATESDGVENGNVSIDNDSPASLDSVPFESLVSDEVDEGTGGTDGDSASAGNSGGFDGTPVVDVSDESISAIADAVTGEQFHYSNQYAIATDNGFNFTIDTNEDSLGQDVHIIVCYSGLRYEVLFADAPAVGLNGTQPYLTRLDSSVYKYYNDSITVDGSVISFDSLSDLSNFGSFNFKTIVYSTCHLYNFQDGSLYYISKYDAPPTFTVSFDTGDSDLIYDSQALSSLQTLNLPDVPDVEGFTFDGWFMDPEYTIQFNTDFVLSNDIVLYGKFTPVPVVSFSTPFDDLTYENQYSNALQIPKPEYDGYTFVGWYYDVDYSDSYATTDVIKEDITLYARFVEETAMTVFTSSVFDSLTALFEVEAIRYVLAIMALVIIFGAVKILASFR